MNYIHIIINYIINDKNRVNPIFISEINLFLEFAKNYLILMLFRDQFLF